MTSDMSDSKPAVVLVHGGFVDGSGWQRVYSRLRQDGYGVSIVQNPTCRSRTTLRPRNVSSQRRRDQSSSWDIPTAEP
jgi:hypothetical protein